MYKKASLRSKRFRLVSEQRNTEEGTLGFDRARNETRAKKERGGGGREGRKPSFLPHPLPALLLAPFFSGSLILVPRSFLLNRTETLATQATKKRAERAEMLFCFSLDYYIIIVGFRNVSNKIQ